MLKPTPIATFLPLSPSVIEAASLINSKETPIMNTKTLDLECGFSRRAVIQGGSLLTTAMLVPGVSFAAGAAGDIAVKSIRRLHRVRDQFQLHSSKFC